MSTSCVCIMHADVNEYVHTVFSDAPRLPSVSVYPTDVIVEGTSVSLTCSSDAHPAANYSWIKENGRQSSPPLSRKEYLVFSSIKSTDSGEYLCTAESDLGRNTASKLIIVQCKSNIDQKP